MKQKKIILLVLALSVTLIGFIVYNYIFHSTHRNIAIEKANIILFANDLHSNFLNDESLATANYLDKVIETRGNISSIEKNGVVLNNRIQVSFNTEVKSKLIDGASLIIKGRCVGYDELLEMVKIDQAIVINKEN
jgi:hypothetical protein